jgi:hypothetical protein
MASGSEDSAVTRGNLQKCLVQEREAKRSLIT